MPNLNLSEDQVVELAKQLPPSVRRSLAVALLREVQGAPDLDTLRGQSQAQLKTLLKSRGVDIDTLSPEEIDEIIRRICEE